MYPFHAAEKTDILSLEIINRKNCALNIFNYFKIEHDEKYIQEILNLDQIENFTSIYGKEAVIISMFLHPIYKKITLSANEIFTCWKLLNKIWKALNDESVDDENINISFHMQNALKKIEAPDYKLHLYVSSIFHIIRDLKHNKLSNSQKLALLNFIEPLTPLLVKYFKNNKN